MDRRPQSQKYQWQLLEICVDFSALDLPEDTKLNPVKKDRCYDLTDQLLARLLQIANQKLTPKQAVVLASFLAGNNQRQIAKNCGYQPTRVYRIFTGNAIYANGKLITRHGGIFKKLRHWTKNDQTCQAILAELMELRNGNR